MRNLDPAKIIDFALFFPGFLLSLSFHEAAHGLVAFKLGDPTAKAMGRVSLNPFAHADPIGTFLLPIVGFFWGGFLVGWGIPVPIDYRNFKSWKKDALLVALAGPVSNLLLAVLFAGIIHLMAALDPNWFRAEGINTLTFVAHAVVTVFYLNLALAFFNLIPIHPLDGGKILYGLLPATIAETFDSFATRYGFILLILLLVSGLYRYLVGIPMNFMAELLL